jgi:uncharacterized cupredoxin-like copper-binding protein
MRTPILIAALAVGSALIVAPGANAEGDLSKQDPITVVVHLGKEGLEQHKFHPDKLTFETGKLYKLVLHNPSNSKHYFSSYGLAHAVWTRKVQVMDDFGAGAKTIAEVKGPTREIEVYPGGTTEWWFVPVSSGVFADLHCSIEDKDGKKHAETGMTGTITVM